MMGCISRKSRSALNSQANRHNCTVALVLGRSKISQLDTLFHECSQQVGAVFEPRTDSCHINCCSPLQRRYSDTGPTYMGKLNSPDVHHHQQVKSAQSSFQRQVELLVAVFENMGNPFNEASNDFLVLDTRDIADVKVSKTVREVERIGKHSYVKERLVSQMERTKPILDVIKQNVTLPIFRNPRKSVPSKEKQNMVSLKQNCSLSS